MLVTTMQYKMYNTAEKIEQYPPFQNVVIPKADIIFNTIDNNYLYWQTPKNKKIKMIKQQDKRYLLNKHKLILTIYWIL